MTDNVIDMDEWVQRKADELASVEQWEHELAVSTAHSVAHLYIEKLKTIYPHASEAFLIYQIMGGLMGRTLELLVEGDAAAPAVIGWMDFIANEVADKEGIDLSDEAMNAAMDAMYQHRWDDAPEAE